MSIATHNTRFKDVIFTEVVVYFEVLLLAFYIH